MIRVEAKPEYPSFDADVRRPGTAFLATCPAPNSEQFRKKNFWSRSARELHAAYSGICAYTAMYLPEQWTVDHFLPKTTHPSHAYDWSNFRLASGRVNNSKGNQPDIIDPFMVDNDWFYIDIPACLLRPNPALEKENRVRVAGTINSLRLNQDDNYVQERCNILMDYAREDVSFNFLERRYPFLAKEVARQGLTPNALRTLFKL
ncbi:MAG: hypothetical protein E5Y30_08905 [Mesorhizobium sp.]|nr:MAG: hypothetical protein E5Y30_08905 [Mesorhizobium sp.]